MGVVSAGLQAVLFGAFAAWLTFAFTNPLGQAWTLKDYIFVVAVVVAVFYNRLSSMKYEKLTKMEQLKKLAHAHPFQRIEFIHGVPVHSKVNTVTCILFFGTWCEKSRAALKELEKMRLHYASKQVQYIALTQETKEELAAYEVKGRSASDFKPLKEFGFSIAIEDGLMSKQYLVRCNVFHIPQVFVIGKDQSIIWYGAPTHKDWTEALRLAMEAPEVELPNTKED